MTELEKMDAGLEYYFMDEDVDGRKKRAMRLCDKFNSIDCEDYVSQLATLKELFGSSGKNIYIHRYFNCDDGKNIHIGEDFIANYNVTILDIAPVHIGDYCMIGPNTLIATVNHPLSPKERMLKKAIGIPVSIGNNVWIGGNCTILPGSQIGNNVVVAAGAVVSGRIPDNSLVGGCPAKIIKKIENDLDN